MSERPWDPDVNSRESWELCIRELRKRHVIAGKDQPRNEEELQWLREAKL